MMMTPTTAKKGKIAVILVRGLADRSYDVLRTLELLHLQRKNHCVVIDNTPSNKGMVDKVKDFVTWGDVTDDVLHDLVKKRGEEVIRLQDRHGKYQYRALVVGGKKYKLYFRLNPPRKGFGRKGLKVAFRAGGALGYRGDKINDLITRML